MGQTLGTELTQTKQKHTATKIGSIKNGKINYPKD
jgi:hypothetical protein